jgi:hypothetical protein
MAKWWWWWNLLFQITHCYYYYYYYYLHPGANYNFFLRSQSTLAKSDFLLCNSPSSLNVVVAIVTGLWGWMSTESWFYYRQGREVYFFSNARRLALELNKLPSNGYRGSLPQGMKLTNHLNQTRKLTVSWSIPLLPHIHSWSAQGKFSPFTVPRSFANKSCNC